MDAQKRSRLRRLLERIGNGIVRDIPPGLAACEICKKTECAQDEWIACENRIAHAKCLEGLEDERLSR